MRILQLYLLKELAAPLLVSLGFFSGVIALRQLFALAELLLNASVPGGTLAQIIGIVLVTALSLTVPMAMLLAVLIGVGRMTNENEILAIRVAGISLVPLFAPVVALSLAMSLLLMVGNMTVFPALVQKLTDRTRTIKFEVLTSLKPGVWYSELSPRDANLAIYFEELAPDEPGDGAYSIRMREIAMQSSGLFDAESAGRTDEAMVFARAGRLLGNIETGDIDIELEDGTILPLGGDQDDEAAIVRFGNLRKTFRPEGDQDDQRVNPQIMTLPQLLAALASPPDSPRARRDYDNEYPRAWRDYFKLETEFHRRWSISLSVLAFVVIAIPLAIEIRPAAKTWAFLIALGLIFLYYILLTWGSAVGSAGSRWTPLAMSTPNVVLVLIGAALFWRSQRA